MDPRTGAVIRLLGEFDAAALARRIDRPYAVVLPYVAEARELHRNYQGLCHLQSRRRERWTSDYNDALVHLGQRLTSDLTAPIAPAPT